MLRRLRWQLTFLYILVALGLVVLTGVGAYSLLKYYFQRETDLALEYKMAGQFRAYGLAPPAELQQAELDWLGQNTALRATPTPPLPTLVPEHAEDGDDHEDGERNDDGGEAHASPHGEEERYDGQLASIFVLPVGADGKVIASSGAVLPPFVLDEAAGRAALANGRDLRTVRQAGDSQVRLLTYRLSGPDGPVMLQIGRPLSDQQRVLSQFLLGILLVCGLCAILLGLGSWWLSGRSLNTAQRAWDQQQAFVSNASHELRTPLTLIKASAEVARRSDSPGEQQELLGDILGEVDYMNHLVDDLLLLSRLDTHRLQLTHESIPVQDLLGEVSRQAQKLAAGKNISLEIVPAPDLTLRADPARLRQVLLILVDNAIRYTPPGGLIRLEGRARARLVQISVSDNGAGIPPEHLTHVFERFYQVTSNTEAQPRTNGLGLSIAKGIIEAQGGKIRIESQVGEGTRVVIELPA